jgi:hypothetical protein
MVRAGSPQEPRDEARTQADLAELYAQFLDAIRRGAPQQVWQDLHLRLAELRQRLDMQADSSAERPLGADLQAGAAGLPHD